jgi:opacity protein-like surface antigen
MYLKITPSFETPGPAFGRTDLSLEQTLLDLKGTYRIVESDKGWVELLVGARYNQMDIGLTLQPGLSPLQSASGTEGWWDAVGGLRARYNLSDRLFLTGLADVGGGSSDLTWQAMAGVGYQFNERTHLTAGYRYMDYDYESSDFKYDVDTRGAYLELGFTW